MALSKVYNQASAILGDNAFAVVCKVRRSFSLSSFLLLFSLSLTLFSLESVREPTKFSLCWHFVKRYIKIGCLLLICTMVHCTTNDTGTVSSESSSTIRRASRNYFSWERKILRQNVSSGNIVSMCATHPGKEFLLCNVSFRAKLSAKKW